MDIYKLADLNDVQVKNCGNGHLQLLGKLLVNYYPESKRRTAYVDGTKTSKNNVEPDEAIRMTMTPPKITSNKDKRSKPNTNRKRKVLLFKRIKSCHWCSTPLTLKIATLEHVIPLARGGLDNMNNLTLACEKCNSERGCNMPEIESYRGEEE